MSENQNTEWKSTWRDEYIKWVCGFANAKGGVLEIGKDDKGNVVGINNGKKLLEDIPNQVRDILGIMVDVDLHQENGKEWLSIEVEPYPYPINYKGVFHYRSGSTKQELRGAALSQFLLQKQGLSWDGVPVPNINVDALDDKAFAYFKKQAKENKRVLETDLNVERKELLEKLRLLENGLLKRAALLLFHDDPERFLTGAYVKIGYFKSDHDLRFQDEINGNLFQQVEKTMELLLTKYLIAGISYKGIHRAETYPYPEAALREAVINAIAHKDYGSGNPIQISVYDDKIIFWNAGTLPENWTVARLKEKHPSVPFNPDVARTFFRAGLIEAWGRGTLKIVAECEQHGIPEPAFKYDPPGFLVEFQSDLEKMSEKMSEKTSEKTSEKILALIKEDAKITIAQLSEKIGVTERTVERNLKKLQKEKLLERIGGAKGGHWELI